MKSVAIIGSGPAALMAATVVAEAGLQVTVFEKKKKLGLKLLIAGSSGLNVTNSLDLEEFATHYGNTNRWQKILKIYGPKEWLGFIHALGIKTFEGTSSRFFVEGMKALKLLRSWRQLLAKHKVTLDMNHELIDFKKDTATAQYRLTFANQNYLICDAVCFCLGGASYEPDEEPLRWPNIFLEKNIGFTPFSPANVGYKIAWNQSFIKEAEGKPLKNISLKSSKGARQGDAVITSYGMEGTPVYFVGEQGELTLDLKPDMSCEDIEKKCLSIKENLSPLRRVKKQLSLCPAALALLFHHGPEESLSDVKRLAFLIKNFPLRFGEAQPLSEAISSAGGLKLSELNDQLMLHRFPGIFAAGEMLDWTAPTGGFLIQGCVSEGFIAGKGIVSYLHDQH